MPTFDATLEFSKALTEVDILIRESASNSKNPDVQDAFNKGAILLLVAKVEAFFEHIVEEFCFRLSSRGLKCEQIPDPVRLHATRRLLNDELLAALKHCKGEKVFPVMKDLSLLWHDGSVLKNIKVDSSFSYGKHGEAEVRRLFQRIGVDDVFETCKISDDQETLAQVSSQPTYVVSSDVNALTGYRNNILHSDGTPNITRQQIEGYRARLFRFAETVDQHLDTMDRNL
ncbi:MAG: HEPN domain-containing protein [Candidatus Zixiibacteriota bacterium]